jgi:hypothetical protein
MKRIIIFSLLLFSTLSSLAQIKKVDDSPKSKLEAFSEKAGSLIKKEFITVGRVNNRFAIQILKLTDILNNTTVVGLRFEGEGTNTYSSTKVAFLDSDEVDGLIKSLTYINTSVLNTAPPDVDVEYNFHARSGFSSGVFNYHNKWMGYMKLVNYDSDSQFTFSVEDFHKALDLVVLAKSKL